MVARLASCFYGLVMTDARAELERADALAARAHRDASQYPRLMVALGLTWGAFVLAVGLVPTGFGWFLAVLLPFAAATGLLVAWMARLHGGVTACVRSIRLPLFLSAVAFGFGLGFLQATTEREPEDLVVTPVVAAATAAPLLVGARRYDRRLRRGLAGE